MIKNIKWLLLVSLTFVACNSNDDEVVAEVPVTAGSANFSKYVSLGNSLTSGFSDNALFKKGQEGAYTNIIAQQFKLAGGGEFKIPYMNDNVGGLLFSGAQNPAFGPRLYFNGAGASQVTGPPTTEVFNPAIVSAGPYNNVGVPGAKSFHLLSPTYGSPAGLGTTPPTSNPYYVRFAPNGTTSVLAYAMSQTPTFFSLWIGNNDVLGYATTGGDGSNPITPTTGVAGVGFDGTYTALVNTLTSAGAKGVVANIPYVNTIPFFTTVGYNPATLSAAQVTALNSAYAAYNGGLTAAKNLGLITEAERVQRTINFVVGKNAVVMVDEYLTDITAVSPSLIKMRQTTSTDYIVLSSLGTPAQTHLMAGNGTAAPLQDRWVLSKNEVAELKIATDAYNLTIKSLADSKGLAFVDANALLSQVANGGIRFGNYHLSSSFAVGGAFSMDGVHPSPRGYALIANKFLEAINAKYGSTFRPVDLGLYQIQYPAVIN
jgi:hypothetical protein